MDEDAGQELVRIRACLRHKNSKFHRKIEELKVLKSTLEEACHQGKVTDGHRLQLQELLDELAVLKRENETLTDDFNIGFGAQAPEDAENADTALEKALSEYHKTSLGATKLLWRMEKQIAAANNHKEKHDNHQIKSLELDTRENIERSYNHDQDGSELESDKDDAEPETVGGTVSLKKSLVKGLLIAIIFYFGLGVIIKVVLDSRSDAGEC